MKKTIAAAVAAAALVLGSAVPANATGAAAPPQNIVEVAVAASGGGTPDNNLGDYDILVQALIATDLAPVLADASRQFTVFAPNDRAFLRLVGDLTGTVPASEADALAAIVGTFSIPQISNILLYHVVADKKLGPLDVLTSRTIVMANGLVIRPLGPVLRDQNADLRNPVLVLRAINIQASNGVIHTIDRVLVPVAP
ncbi:fasciclin domain-containing protein [Micromonospora sp. DT81.3]|uniref:fasciclin domain-containing protein n=1 Tax=Micromonospora sp. DT81.3 TaxID=3416523 RepID=UPI003CEEA5AB